MSRRNKKFDNANRGSVSKKEIERRTIYTETILRPKLVQPEVFTRKQGERIVEISPNFGIYFPANEVIEIKGGEENFLLQRAGKNLNIWLDPEEERTITIGSSDYYLNQEGKLIELEEIAFALLPRRKPNTKDYPLTKDEKGRFVINLRSIEGNEKIDQFFKK